MRITDLVVAVSLNYPYSRYDTMTLAAFDLATAVLAIWLRVNLANEARVREADHVAVRAARHAERCSRRGGRRAGAAVPGAARTAARGTTRSTETISPSRSPAPSMWRCAGWRLASSRPRSSRVSSAADACDAAASPARARAARGAARRPAAPRTRVPVGRTPAVGRGDDPHPDRCPPAQTCTPTTAIPQLAGPVTPDLPGRRLRHPADTASSSPRSTGRRTTRRKPVSAAARTRIRAGPRADRRPRGNPAPRRPGPGSATMWRTSPLRYWPGDDRGRREPSRASHSAVATSRIEMGRPEQTLTAVKPVALVRSPPRGWPRPRRRRGRSHASDRRPRKPLAVRLFSSDERKIAATPEYGVSRGMPGP